MLELRGEEYRADSFQDMPSAMTSLIEEGYIKPYARLGALALTMAIAFGSWRRRRGLPGQAAGRHDFEKGKDSRSVTFSHEKHLAAGNKSTSCHVRSSR